MKKYIIRVLKYLLSKCGVEDKVVTTHTIDSRTLVTLESIFKVPAWTTGKSAEDWAYATGCAHVVDFLRKDYESGGKLVRERGTKENGAVLNLKRRR